MSDVAYQTKDTLVTSFGPTWLWRWRQSLNLNHTFRGEFLNLLIGSLRFRRPSHDERSLKGHPKTGQRRSPQNRPMKAARDQVVLPRLAVIEQACFSTPTPWATLENVTMMEEAVEHGGHGRTIP